MKTTISKEFFEKWKDEYVVMWCKKEEYAEEFCRLMHKQGLSWASGKSYLKENHWKCGGWGMAYAFNRGGYSDRGIYERLNHTILDFEDYIIKEKTYKYEIGYIDGDKTFFTEVAQETKNNLEQHDIPAHYNIAGIDTMDLIITICEHNKTNQRETFYLANTLKYLIRYKNKNGLEDLKKAKDYLNRLIEYTTIENLPFYNVDGQGD